MNTSFDTAVPRIVTEVSLCAWLGNASAGDKLIYHRGFLAIDTDSTQSKLPRDVRAELSRVARRILTASDMGLAVLVQRRHGPDDYSYIIVAQRKSIRAPDIAKRGR